MTQDALLHVDRHYINRTALTPTQLKDLERQFAIVLSNERVKDRSLDALLLALPPGLLLLATANALVAVLAYRVIRSSGKRPPAELQSE